MFTFHQIAQCYLYNKYIVTIYKVTDVYILRLDKKELMYILRLAGLGFYEAKEKLLFSLVKDRRGCIFFSI